MGKLSTLEQRFDGMGTTARMAMNATVLVPTIVVGFAVDLPRLAMVAGVVVWAVIVAVAFLAVSERMRSGAAPRA
jgi:hypothetical protein